MTEQEAKKKAECIQEEMEYREWRKNPQWYCVKTTMHNNGKIESEIMADEKTKLPITVISDEKPMDGVFETVKATTYYAYYSSYKDAAQQVAMAKMY